MSLQADDDPTRIVARVEQKARLRVDAPCADGTMPFRIWGDGPTLVLCHGGSGSWTHWIRNIEGLARHYRVVVPDLPGLGDAATVPPPYTPDSSAAIVNAALDHVLARNEPVHLAAFSWGCTQAARIAGWRQAQVRSLFLVGPASLGDGYARPTMLPLQRRSRSMSTAELDAIARHNLRQLMIHDDARIDALAIHLQHTNTSRSRMESPQFARGTWVLDGLRETRCPLKVLFGEFDAPAFPDIDARRQRLLGVRPDMEFECVPGVGHWTQYEWAGFDDCLTAWLRRIDRR
jgi:pimeloyl-ACP methyl ester carboxylesterase